MFVWPVMAFFVGFGAVFSWLELVSPADVVVVSLEH